MTRKHHGPRVQEILPMSQPTTSLGLGKKLRLEVSKTMDMIPDVLQCWPWLLFSLLQPQGQGIGLPRVLMLQVIKKIPNSELNLFIYSCEHLKEKFSSYLFTLLLAVGLMHVTGP